MSGGNKLSELEGFEPTDNVVEKRPDAEMNGDNLEIEIVDDTPEVDRGRPRRDENAKPDVPDDDEIARYSHDVQKRMKKMKWEFHEERRAKEQAIREAQEAARFAKQVYDQNQYLQNTVRGGEKVLVDQAKGRVEAEMASAKALYKKAYEEGDTENLIRAQEAISSLTVQRQRVADYQPTQFAEVQTPSSAPQAPAPDAMYVEWKDRNKWFQNDDEMTSFAMGVHKKLVESGVDPRSKEYYDKIDARVRQVFPDNFSHERGGGSPARVRSSSNVVAPAVRTATGSNTSQRVQLSATQVSLAKRLGLTPQQYAAQLLKESQ
jgi:hypothetical protein